MWQLANLLTFYSFALIFVESRRSFTINYENDTFLRDGKPFRYISGSIHYNRLSADHWKGRLLMMKAAGLNAISTYVPWNYHEPKPGVYDFTGNLDLFQFLNIAQSLDFVVILRVGPYTCAGWDFGGLAGWLMETENILVRTNDPVFMKAVYSWLDFLLPKVKPYLYENGGPVITVQIENEYGSLNECDHTYLNNLRDRFRLHLAETVVLFTTDGSADRLVKCGKIDGVYATVDFGLTEFPEKAFAPQRKVEPKGPLVCSEFYVEGNIDYWGLNFSTLNYKNAALSLDKILKYGANINLYMFPGGTNFGYYNGGMLGSKKYFPVITSYDHDSPITEAGQLTDKYFALRSIILTYSNSSVPPIPRPPSIYAYGNVTLQKGGDLFEELDTLCVNPVLSEYPLNMERVQQYYGFILYRHTSKVSQSDVLLVISNIRDRAHVFINQELIGMVNREDKDRFMVSIRNGENLDILVENQGRIYGTDNMHYNRKGIIDNVTLDMEIVKDWKIFPLNLTNHHPIKNVTTRLTFNTDKQIPAFYFGYFQIPDNMSDPEDTFIDVQPFQKGQLFINGVNIGRYWPFKGPQVTLYIPKSVLKPYPMKNLVTLFELDQSPCYDLGTCVIKFVDHPKLNKTIGEISDSGLYFTSINGED